LLAQVRPSGNKVNPLDLHGNVMAADISTLIAWLALPISFLAYLNSKKAFELSKQVASEERCLNAERARSEALERMALEKKEIEGLIRELSLLEVVFKNEHPAIQATLRNYSDIFDNVQRLQELLRRIDFDYQATKVLDPSCGADEFLRRKSHYIYTHESTMVLNLRGCITEVCQRIEQARQCHSD
jgi:hypothetical protein